MSEETVIIIKDNYGESCLSDKLNRKGKKDRKPAGYVEIYEKDEKGEDKLLGKENLVLYQGREWLITRAFNFANGSIGPVPSEYICWFGLGDGGCYGYDPLVPIPPENLDTELNHVIPINTIDTSYADYHDGAYHKMPVGTIIYEQDSDNDNKYLIAQIVTTVGNDDGNGFSLSEVGMYTASSNTGGYVGPFHLYAKATFPSILKSSSRVLIFVWYVYF